MNQNLSKYFSSKKYLLKDSIYLSIKIIISFYKGVTKNNSQNTQKFNQFLLSIYIDIESIFGILKG